MILCVIALIVSGVRVEGEGVGVGKELCLLNESAVQMGGGSFTNTPTPTERVTPTSEPTLKPTSMPTPTATPTPKVKYTFTEMNRSMYASADVNVRTLPNTDGAVIGTVWCGDSVFVTGKCNEVNWYRVEYNGATAYVYGKYLMEHAPTPTPTPVIHYANSFCVDDEENIYVLDSFDTKLVKLEGEQHTDIDLPGCVFPADVMERNGKFYVYDEILNQLLVYNGAGKLLCAAEVPLEGDFVKRIAPEEAVVLVTYGGKRLVFEEETGTFSEEKYQEKTVYAEGADFCDYIGEDPFGIRYSLNTTLLNGYSLISGEIMVCASTPEGELFGGYILPTLECVYLPDHYVRFTGDGSVYVLMVKEEGVVVEQVPMSLQPVSYVAQIEKEVKSKETAYMKNSNYRIKKGTTYTGQPKLTREESYARAEYMSGYTWKLTEKNTDLSRVPKAVLPRYIAAIAKAMEGKETWEVEMHGIPYCWGGFTTPYRARRYRFDVVIGEKNYIAGNINSEGDYLGYTAGLDCSGYVTALFALSSKLSTTNLSDMGSRITDVTQLQKMDILVAPGDHIVAFCGWLDDGTMLATEAAIRDGRVTMHPRTINSFLIESTFQMRSPW